MFHIHYWDNVLSPLAGRSNKPCLIKYDPRDLSRVFLEDPNGDYWPIPYRDLGTPPISLWEHRNALRQIREHGRSSVDEAALFATVSEQRTLIAEAKARTRSQRLAAVRVREALTLQKPQNLARSDPSDPVPGAEVLPFPVDEW
jgi:putative transposase